MSPVADVIESARSDAFTREADPALRPRLDDRGARHDIDADELTSLVQRLFLPGGAQRPIRSMLFAAVGSDAASASVCVGTGSALARHTAASICIVDADLRSPSLDAAFGVTAEKGLSNVLLGECTVTSCVTRLRDNLWLLSAGSSRAGSVGALTASGFAAQLRELQHSYAHVLVNVSGAAAHRDLMALAPVVDGVVLVIDSVTSRRETARRVADELKTARIHVLGAVLTNRTFPIPPSLYRRL
jgi:Mrp family chromosome partitioning ATPase